MSKELLNEKLNELSDDMLEDVAGGVNVLEASVANIAGVIPEGYNSRIIESSKAMVEGKQLESHSLGNNTPAGTSISNGLDIALNGIKN